MENRHHSRKRRHTHEHDSGHGESRKHHKHSHHKTTRRRHSRGHSVEQSVGKRQQLKIEDQYELSGGNDYVRRWLAQTQKEVPREPPREPRAGHIENRAKDLHYTRTIQDLGEYRNAIKSKPGKERACSDSSLLDLPTAPIAERTTTYPPNPRATSHSEEFARAYKQQKTAPSTITSDSSHSLAMKPKSKQETFEKRARHKTREDRYDIEIKTNKAEAVEKPIRTRREKKGDRRKAIRKASEDLMISFASNKIGQTRLTTRPSNGPGIFQNGRASSPPRRRGLPDLAFSEMDFLQRSNKKSQINDTAAVFKNRAKDKKKAAREQNEIAAFFGPTKTPIRGTSTIEHPTSPSSVHETSLYERQLRRDREHDQYQYFTSNPISCVEKPKDHSRESRDKRMQYNQVSIPREPNPRPFSREVGNYDMLQEPTVTVVTWSDSCHSPGATMALRRAREGQLDREQSATPESIRSSIERTGIFKNTGIGISGRRRPRLLKGGTEEVDDPRKKHSVVMTKASIEANEESSQLSTNSTELSHEIAGPQRTQQQGCVSQLPQVAGKNVENSTLKRRPPDSGGIKNDGRRRIVVEYYDPDRGWYREEGLKSPSKSRKSSSGPALLPMPAPVTRQQIARMARIKRPSTTLPVIRETSHESFENSLSIPATLGRDIQRTESAPVKSSSARDDMGEPVPIAQTKDGKSQETSTPLDPPVPDTMTSQIDTHFQRNPNNLREYQTESTGNIRRNEIVADGRERQGMIDYANDRTRIPLRATSQMIQNRGELQPSAQHSYRPTFPGFIERPRQHMTSTPRSPLIQLPSLYIRQLEHGQERDQIASGLFDESLEAYGASEGKEGYIDTPDRHENHWYDAETEHGASYDVEDALQDNHYIGDRSELDTSGANIIMIEDSRPEVTSFGYVNSGLDLQPSGYQHQHVQEDGYNHWDVHDYDFQGPWFEGQRYTEQQYEMDYHSNRLAQPLFRGDRELDGSRDGNVSESIPRQRFWRPNPQY